MVQSLAIVIPYRDSFFDLGQTLATVISYRDFFEPEQIVATVIPKGNFLTVPRPN